jgi:hypothetical protein
MLESDVGDIVNATRQKSGSPVIAAPVGGTNVPPVTDCAVVIVVNGMDRDARLSQTAPAAGDAVTTNVLITAPIAAK